MNPFDHLLEKAILSGFKTFLPNHPESLRGYFTLSKDHVKIALSNQVLFQESSGFGPCKAKHSYPSKNIMTLEGIYVDPENRRKGWATKILSQFCFLADQSKIILRCEPSPFELQTEKKIPRKKLVDWYFSFGFQKEPDFNTDWILERLPKIDKEFFLV